MHKLTIFTPSYNRAYTLERLYKSLLEQTNKNFEWIIVDDGSTDHTKELIKEWILEKKIQIKYFYQSNRGKHIAQNLGVEKASGELFTCLDSDDWFYSDTVEKILNIYNIENNNIVGIIGVDTYENGKVVGNEFRDDLKYSNWKDLNFKHKMKGDKAIIFRTSIIKDYPFPDNKDKHMPPSYQLYKIDDKFHFYITNERMKFVEYLPDGITQNIRKKYKIAPNNYCEYRILMMKISPQLKFTIKSAIHFNISKKYAKKWKCKERISLKNKLLIFFTYPIGVFIWSKIERRM